MVFFFFLRKKQIKNYMHFLIKLCFLRVYAPNEALLQGCYLLLRVGGAEFHKTQVSSEARRFAESSKTHSHFRRHNFCQPVKNFKACLGGTWNF